MPRNASGTYSLPSGNPVVSGTTIQASWANTTLSDVGSEITNSLSRAGAGGMTGAFRAVDGSSTVPGIAWGSETTTGFYRAGSADTRLVITSAEVQKWLATGSSITGTFSVSGTTTLASLTASKAVFTDASKNLTSTGTLGVDQGGTGATTLTGVVKGNGTSAFTAGSVSLTSEVTGTLPVANGGTGAATFTANNVLLGNGTSAFQVVAPGSNGNVLTSNGTTWTSAAPAAGISLSADNTWTGTQTFAGTSAKFGTVLTNAAETATVSATAATGTINYDITTQSVLYYTSNASANWTVNFRASSGTSLNTALATGQSVTVAFLVTQGATAYYNNVVQVDGTTSGVTTRWIGGAPTAGNASGIDSYRYVIIKTASATFTVLASVNQFKA